MKKQTKIITTILITSTVAILCAAILVAAIIHSGWLFGSSSMFSDYSSAIETTIIEETIIQETSSTESTISSITTQQPPPQTTPSDLYEPNEENIKYNVTVVQPADPKTGISWDGVSPIIYTYPDGTTGTEPRDGATYEYLPGMIVTYKVERDGIGREVGTICEFCHRQVACSSDGIYCDRNPYSEYCHDCGVYVEAYTCHTCAVPSDYTFYCSQCGKIQGEGNNGTCLCPLGDMICPNCGKALPAYVCHTCG